MIPPQDPRHFAAFDRFDPADSTVIRRPPGEGAGYWAGAPGVRYDARDDTFYLLYRLRRPRGVEPDRGGEVHLAASRDGVEFNTIWVATKGDLESKSIERCALGRTADGGWLLYISYVDPADVSENYEERVGLAFSFDLRTFHRVSRAAPLMTTPSGKGALRYFDVVALPRATFFYYEIALPDGSHELRVHRR